MAAIKIRLASRAYDGVLPILRGQMAILGFDFDFTDTEDVPGMFAGMFNGQYDISEANHRARRDFSSERPCTNRVAFKAIRREFP